MCRKSLKDYAIIPMEMQFYMRNHGRSFSKKACEFAVRMMKRKSKATDKIEPMEYINKEKVEEMLEKNGVKLERNIGYNFVYVANKEKCKRWKSSVEDELHLCKAIKEEIDDEFACTDSVFNRWVSDMEDIGVPIPWADLI